MAVNLSFIGGAGWQFFDDNGDPLNGGKIYTYLAGSTTPLTTYTSRSGLVPNTNPIILDAAGRTPEQIWSTEGVLYKYVVKTSNDTLIRTWDNIGGSVVASDLGQDLANTTVNSKGDALVGFRQSDANGFLTGAVGRTVNAKFQEFVSVKDFGAVGDGVANDTAAIQAAINSNAPTILFPPGTYLANNLTQTLASQVFLGLGRATIKKNANGVLLTASGRDFVAQNLIFDGRFGGFTGGCFLGLNDVQSLLFCGARTAAGFAVEMRGSTNQIIGTNDIYFSDDAAGGPIKIGSNSSSSSLYNRIISITASTSAGKILFENSGPNWLIGSQTKDITAQVNGGVSISNCRVVGSIELFGSFSAISASSIAQNVTIGNGVNIISSITLSPDVVVASTGTITINQNIRESVIYTSQFTNNTIIDNLTGTTNDIDNTFFGRPTAFTPTWSGGDGTQSIGDGTLAGIYTRNGRSIIINFNMQMGATTTYGTGTTEYKFLLPIKARNTVPTFGVGYLNQSANYVGALQINANTNELIIQTNGGAGPVRYDRPEVWAVGQRMRGTIEYVTV